MSRTPFESKRLRQISKLRSGSLSKVPFAELLFAHSLQKRTLAIEIHRLHVKKAIILEHGQPIECRSNLLHETFGQYLVGRGAITDFQAREALAEAADKGVRLGEVLLEKGWIEPVDLYRALQQNLAHKLLECFTWFNGEFQILPDLSETDCSIQLNVLQLLFTGITKFASQEHVHASVGHLIGTQLALHPSPSAPIDELKFSTGQRRVIAQIAQHARTTEIFAQELISSDELVRMLYALSLMGMIVPMNEYKILAQRQRRLEARVSKNQVDEIASPPTSESHSEDKDTDRFLMAKSEAKTKSKLKVKPASGEDELDAEKFEPVPKDRALDALFDSLWVGETDKLSTLEEEDVVELEDVLLEEGIIVEAPVPSRPQPAPEEAPAANAKTDEAHELRNEVMSKYLSHREKTPFEFFELEIGATPDEIRRRYLEYCERYSPKNFEAPELSSVAEQAERLLAATLEAYQILRDDEQRERLVAKLLAAEEKERSILPDDQFSHETEDLGREYCNQGYERMETSNFSAASALFELATKTDPGETLYRVELSYCRFRQYSGNAERSFRELLDVLEKDSACVQASLYAAEIAHSLGYLERAEELFLEGCSNWSRQLRDPSFGAPLLEI